MHHPLTPHESTPRPRPAHAPVVVAILTLLAVLLTGCGGGASTSTAGTSAGSIARNAEQTAGVGAPAKDSVGSSGLAGAGDPSGTSRVAEGVRSAGAGSAPGAAARSAAGSKAATPVVGAGPKLTKSASLDIQVRDITAAAARVRVVAAGLQAQVVSEQIGRGGTGDPVPLPGGKEQAPGTRGSDGFGTLTLSVPSDKLDAALDQLARIGVVRQRSTSSQDVTAQYVDTQSRLKTMRASVERVRALMTQAKDLGQVVALESELSRRQADLESMESQLTALKSSVDRSTLAVSLSTPGSEPTSSNDFLAGLRSGWDAFTSSTGGLLRGIGAVLPFALFFTLAGLPLVSWLRRRRMVSAT